MALTTSVEMTRRAVWRMCEEADEACMFDPLMFGRSLVRSPEVFTIDSSSFNTDRV
jgi:hypothetical protein